MTESVDSRLRPAGSVDPATQVPISTEPLVSKQTRRTTTIVSVIVGIVVLAALVAIGYFLYVSYNVDPAGPVPAAVRLRDIAFIVMALETLVLMILVLIVIVLLVITVVLIYDRVIPILEQLNKSINTVSDTVHTVRGTTTFVSDKVVTPFIEVSSYASGVARICKGILDLWPGRNKRHTQEGQTARQQEPPASNN